MLLGRGSECAVIDRLLERARAGKSGAIVVRGEPGVGKTALLEYAIDAASGPAGRARRGRRVRDGVGLCRAASALRADARLPGSASRPSARRARDHLWVQRRPRAGSLSGRSGGTRSVGGGGRVASPDDPAERRRAPVAGGPFEERLRLRSRRRQRERQRLAVGTRGRARMLRHRRRPARRAEGALRPRQRAASQPEHRAGALATRAQRKSIGGAFSKLRSPARWIAVGQSLPWSRSAAPRNRIPSRAANVARRPIETTLARYRSVIHLRRRERRWTWRRRSTEVDGRQVRGSSAWVSMMCMATSTSR